MSPIRILLADDHIMVREGTRKILEREPDLQVVAEAGNGREAIMLTEREHPDVAIVDISMPVLNGIEATKGSSASRRAQRCWCSPPMMMTNTCSPSWRRGPPGIC
jgi:DNA-binding NarL/FixJ family response regulator